MSNKSRCPDCNHRRGPRVTNPIYKGCYNKSGDFVGKHMDKFRPSKRPCYCECHIVKQELPVNDSAS